MAAAGVPMRTLQEWLGHRDFATTLIYADYQPGGREADLVDAVFGGGGGADQVELEAGVERIGMP